MDGEKEKGWRRMVEEEEIGHGGSLRMDEKKGWREKRLREMMEVERKQVWVTTGQRKSHFFISLEKQTHCFVPDPSERTFQYFTPQSLFQLEFHSAPLIYSLTVCCFRMEKKKTSHQQTDILYGFSTNRTAGGEPNSPT